MPVPPVTSGSGEQPTAGTPASQGNRAGGGLLDPGQLLRSLPDALASSTRAPCGATR